MKEKNVDEETLRFISNMEGFIGVASTLINFDTKYSNVIKNQLGNVLVTNNIDSANAISKKINYRYKIVTLDGEVLNVGGSITGGNLKQNRNIISDKYELLGDGQYSTYYSFVNDRVETFFAGNR